MLWYSTIVQKCIPRDIKYSYPRTSTYECVHHTIKARATQNSFLKDFYSLLLLVHRGQSKSWESRVVTGEYIALEGRREANCILIHCATARQHAVRLNMKPPSCGFFIVHKIRSKSNINISNRSKCVYHIARVHTKCPWGPAALNTRT